MLTFETLPQARVARAAGQPVKPPPVPRTPGRLHDVAAVVFGFWPLTAVMLMMLGMFCLASVAASP